MVQNCPKFFNIVQNSNKIVQYNSKWSNSFSFLNWLKWSNMVHNCSKMYKIVLNDPEWYKIAPKSPECQQIVLKMSQNLTIRASLAPRDAFPPLKGPKCPSVQTATHYFYSRAWSALPCTPRRTFFTQGPEGPFHVLEKAGRYAGHFSNVLNISKWPKLALGNLCVLFSSLIIL